MEQWSVDYVDRMVMTLLDRAYNERRRSVFQETWGPNYDWDKIVGMTTRAWLFIRGRPSWMTEIPFEKTVEQFARLLGFAAEKTTSTSLVDLPAGLSVDPARFHVERQILERDLVTRFAAWTLRSFEIP